MDKTTGAGPVNLSGPTRIAASVSSSETTVHAIQTPRQYSIKELNQDIPAPWIFIGRVLAQNPIKNYTNWYGNGKLSEIHVSDIAGNIMRITLFNAGVDSFYNIVTPGNSCSFSLGRMKHANQAFSPRNSAFEATFDGESDIQRADPGKPEIKEPSFRFTPLTELGGFTMQSVVNIIAIIHKVGSSKRVTTKRGKTVEKLEILVVDDGNAKIVCTLWGFLSRQIDDSCLGRVILVTGGKISDYNDKRSLNIGINTTVLLDPALSRATQLRDWYITIPSVHIFNIVHP